MQITRVTFGIFVAAFLLVVWSSFSLAESKPRVCKPNICQPRSILPKQYKPLLGAKDGLISSQPKVLSKEFTYSINGSGTPSPQIAVPANRTIQSICHVSANNQLKCFDEVSYTGCPNFLSFTVEADGGSLAIVECELSCNPPTPNTSTGTCECDPINCHYV